MAVQLEFSAEPEREAFSHRLMALLAPAATNSGAVVKDPALLDIAKAIYDEFGKSHATEGLTRAQLTAACTDICDQTTFDSRFDLFVNMKMLLTEIEKSHQHRFIFNPTSAAGILVFERIAQRGGVDEIITLLDRARSALESGTMKSDALRDSLHKVQQIMTIMTNYLLRITKSSPLPELISQRQHHDATQLMDEVTRLSDQVTTNFPALDAEAYHLVKETQRYRDACMKFLERILDEGTSARDFSLLDPAEYRTAALTLSIKELAQVTSIVAFDPPSPYLDPAMIVKEVLNFNPRNNITRRVVRPPDPPSTTDPFEEIAKRAEKDQRRLARVAELHLQGKGEVDLTSELRAAGWPGAAVMLATLVAICSEPGQGFELNMADELLVDPDGPVTYLSPVTLRRSSSSNVSLATTSLETTAVSND